MDFLFTRFDGPVPAHILTAAITGEPVVVLRRRCHGREIDRSARDLVQSIAAMRGRASKATSAPCGAKQHLEELSRCLRYYRDLGATLA